MFTTRSTILVPIRTGFTSSFPFEYPRLLITPDFTLPFETCPLEGEHDVLFGTAFELVSVTFNLTLGGPGLSLDAEADLSGRNFFLLCNISGGFFDGLDLTDGELPRDGASTFVAEEDLPPFTDVVSKPDGLDGRVIGVKDLDVDFETEITEGRVVGVEDLDADLAAIMEGLAVGVEDLDDDLEAAGIMLGRAVGVMDLFEGGTGLMAATVTRDVGVDDLNGFVVEGTIGRVVGVEDLDPVDGAFLDGDGRLMVALDDFTPLDDAGSLGTILVVEIPSTGRFSALDSGEVDWLLDIRL